MPNRRNVEIDFDDLDVGDVLYNKYGVKRTILEITDNGLFSLSTRDDQEAHHVWYTTHELEKYKYTTTEPEDDVTEVTLEEIARKFNIALEKLRIKED